MIIVLTANPTPTDPARYTVIDGHREEHAPGPAGAPQFQVITRPERREKEKRAA